MKWKKTIPMWMSMCSCRTFFSLNLHTLCLLSLCTHIERDMTDRKVETDDDESAFTGKSATMNHINGAVPDAVAPVAKKPKGKLGRPRKEKPATKDKDTPTKKKKDKDAEEEGPDGDAEEEEDEDEAAAEEKEGPPKKKQKRAVLVQQIIKEVLKSEKKQKPRITIAFLWTELKKIKHLVQEIRDAAVGEIEEEEEEDE